MYRVCDEHCKIGDLQSQRDRRIAYSLGSTSGDSLSILRQSEIGLTVCASIHVAKSIAARLFRFDWTGLQSRDAAQRICKSHRLLRRLYALFVIRLIQIWLLAVIDINYTFSTKH